MRAGRVVYSVSSTHNLRTMSFAMCNLLVNNGNDNIQQYARSSYEIGEIIYHLDISLDSWILQILSTKMLYTPHH